MMKAARLLTPSAPRSPAGRTASRTGARATAAASRGWLVLVALAALTAGPASCRKSTRVVDSDVTGINLTVHFDPAAALTGLSFSGRSGDAPAFSPGELPQP